MTEKAIIYLRRIVQIASVAVGALGIIWIYFGLKFLVGAMTERDSIGFSITLMFLVFGGVLVAVAWQVVFRYSPSAITSIAVLFGFAVYGFLSQWSRAMWDSAWNGKDIPAQGFLMIFPVAVACIFYRIAKWMLLRMTIGKTE